MDSLNYIFIFQFLLSSMLALVLFIAWYSIQRSAYTLLWSLFFVCSLINLSLNANSNLFPDRDIYWIVVNASSLLMLSVSIASWRLRSGMTVFPKLFLAYIVGVEVLLIFFTVVSPHMGLRMVLIPYATTIMSIICIRALLNVGERKIRITEYGVMFFFLLEGAAQFAAGSVALMQGVEADSYYLNLYGRIIFMLMPLTFTGFGLFTIVILAEDLLQRVKRLEGLLPICSYCKDIRDEQDRWSSLEKYISEKTDAHFSHGVCPKCVPRAKTYGLS